MRCSCACVGVYRHVCACVVYVLYVRACVCVRVRFFWGGMCARVNCTRASRVATCACRHASGWCHRYGIAVTRDTRHLFLQLAGRARKCVPLGIPRARALHPSTAQIKSIHRVRLSCRGPINCLLRDRLVRDHYSWALSIAMASAVDVPRCIRACFNGDASA